MGILLEDLETLYSQLEKGEKLEIGFKTDSYKEICIKVKAYSVSRELMKERNIGQVYQKRMYSLSLKRKKSQKTTLKIVVQ